MFFLIFGHSLYRSDLDLVLNKDWFALSDFTNSLHAQYINFVGKEKKKTNNSTAAQNRKKSVRFCIKTSNEASNRVNIVCARIRVAERVPSVCRVFV